jgi:hypothetical protein
MIAKPISIKDAKRKSGSGARKVVELTSGDLLRVSESRLKASQGALIGQQKSAEGVVPAQAGKARTVLRQGDKGRGK